MKIIDSHFHIYKNEQAGILAQGNKKNVLYCGTYEEAVSILRRDKISRMVAVAVLPIVLMRRTAREKWPPDLTAQKREELTEELEDKLLGRLTRYNEWLCQVSRKGRQIEPFIAANPTIDKHEMTAEIMDKVSRYGVKGIKIHPEVDQIFPFDKGYLPIFEIAEQNDLIVISHGGLSRYQENFCHPLNFCKVMENFPKLRLVVAHFGYPDVKSLIEMAARYPRLYTDTSFIMSNSLLEGKELAEAIRSFGINRVLYGSDFPWVDPEKDVEKLSELGLEATELELLTWKNAVEVFGLE